MCKVCRRCNQVTCHCPKIKYPKPNYSDKVYRANRLAYLSLNPYCADCDGIATEIHHTIKAREQPQLFNEWKHWLGLCKKCHSIRTARGE